MAAVFSIHCLGVRVKLCNPACILNPSKSERSSDLEEERGSSEPVEFHGFKVRVVEMFPYPEKFDCIAVPYPVPDQIIGMVRILVSCNIGNADIIFTIERVNGDFVQSKNFVLLLLRIR